MNNDQPGDARHAELDTIETQAAEWLARRDRGFTPDDAAAFARWRAADPRHETAVADFAAAWGALDDLVFLNRQAQADAAPASRPSLQKPARSRLGSWRPMLAAAACAALLLAAFLWRPAHRPTETLVHYETPVGGQRTIALPDGSELQLNTNSAVDVRYAADQRRVQLKRGEAFFSVTKDPARPFVVTSGAIEARALGTAFVIRQRAAEMELLVTEGRVRFGVADHGATTEVQAGQRAVCEPAKDAIPRVTTLDAAALARQLAWKTGRLEVKNVPLAEVVAEFNRYHREQIVVRDAATGALLVVGLFAIDNLDGFVGALEKSLDVVADRRNANTIVLGSKP